MTDTAAGGFVSVPVPHQHVIAVYALLARLEGAAANAEAPSLDDEDDADEVPAVTWPVEDLRRFAETPTYTSANIGKVLDVLAARPGEYIPTSELEVETGIRRLNLRGSFAALTRHVNTHYGRRGWMLTYRWGPTIGRASEGYYSLSEEQAQAWKEARKG